MSSRQIFLLPEWAEQDAVLMAWPHNGTDWRNLLPEAQKCFAQIIAAILRFESVLLLCPRGENLPKELKCHIGSRLRLIDIPYNDTWARDFGPLSLQRPDGSKIVLDYTFNGWGMKFAANEDNQICRRLAALGIFSEDVTFESKLDFVLEGGAIESDGISTVLTTEHCLSEPNRNARHTFDEIKDRLSRDFGAANVIVLRSGYLIGDDTDGHIDTLARYCSPKDIAYVQCNEESDEHHQSLSQMAEELKSLTSREKKGYRLWPLPMAETVYETNGQRLPATYANFLIINGAVLFPTYGSSPQDVLTADILRRIFPSREVIGIDCSALIRQHGSLHCVTMQIPKGFVHKSFID